MAKTPVEMRRRKYGNVVLHNGGIKSWLVEDSISVFRLNDMSQF